MFENEFSQVGVRFCSIALVACQFVTRLPGDGTGCGHAALLHSCQTAALALGATALGALAVITDFHRMIWVKLIKKYVKLLQKGGASNVDEQFEHFLDGKKYEYRLEYTIIHRTITPVSTQ